MIILIILECEILNLFLFWIFLVSVRILVGLELGLIFKRIRWVNSWRLVTGRDGGDLKEILFFFILFWMDGGGGDEIGVDIGDGGGGDEIGVGDEIGGGSGDEVGTDVCGGDEIGTELDKIGVGIDETEIGVIGVDGSEIGALNENEGDDIGIGDVTGVVDDF